MNLSFKEPDAPAALLNVFDNDRLDLALSTFGADDAEHGNLQLGKDPADAPQILPPVGLPACVDIARMCDTLFSNSCGYNLIKQKSKMAKETQRNREDLNRILHSAPLPLPQIEKLNHRQALTTVSLTIPENRLMLLIKLAEHDQIQFAPEIQWINQYHELIHKKPLIESTDHLQNHAPGLPDVNGAHPLEHLVMSLSIPNGCIADLQEHLLSSRLIRDAYNDLLEDTPRARPAAAMIFALAAIFCCRYPLDFVYQRNEALFNRYYGDLFSRDLLQWTREQEVLVKPSTLKSLQKITPVDFDFSSPQLLQSLQLAATGEAIKAASMQLDILGVWLSEYAPGPNQIDPFFHGLPNQIHRFQELMQSFKDVEQSLTGVRAQALPAMLNFRLDELQKAHQSLINAFPEVTGIPSFPDDRSMVKQLADRLGRSSLSLEMAGLSEEHSWELNSNTLFAEHRSLVSTREDIQQRLVTLAADPIGNRIEIQDAYEQLAVLEPLSLAKQILSAADAVLAIAQDVCDRHDSIAPAEPSCSPSAQADDPHNDPSDALKELQEMLLAQEDELSQVQAQLRAAGDQKSALEEALAKKTCSQTRGLSDELRQCLLKALEGHGSLVPEECLKVVQALHPDVEILPSAWSSAKESSEFQHCAKLMHLFKALCGPYLADIKAGKPDAVARKAFPTNAYAANESSTTTSSKARKLREFSCHGASRYFCKHLRIGVAQDIRKTIRVYFDVIDGRLVIAYCGPHLEL